MVGKERGRMGGGWGGEGGREKGSEGRARVAHITMEPCTVNSLLFGQII